MQASAILDRAKLQLNDAGFVHWTESELLLYLSEGQREAARLNPASTAKTDIVQLTAGETRHQLPSDASALIDVTRNMGRDGLTMGRPITGVDRKALDRIAPTRHSGRGKSVIKHVAYDKNNPLEFETYPKVSDADPVYVEIIYGVSPPDITSNDSELTVINKYVNSLTEYTLFRAFGKDAEYAGEGGRAAQHYQLFIAGLGLQST